MPQSLDLSAWESLPDCTLLTVREAALVLNVSENHLRNAIKHGSLQAHRPAGEGKGPYRIAKRAIIQYLQESVVQTRLAPREKMPKPAPGQRFRHITPTWLHESSRSPGNPDAGQNIRTAPSSSRSRDPLDPPSS